MVKRAVSRWPGRGIPVLIWKMFHKKKLKSILKYISFLPSMNLMWWKDKRIFNPYFTRMQKFFHFRRWEYFFKKQFSFSEKKTGFVSKFFVNVFSKRIDDNRSAHMISSFLFFILWCNMNTHRQKFWQDTKWMRTEEDSFPIALIHARTILVGLSFTNI